MNSHARIEIILNETNNKNNIILVTSEEALVVLTLRVYYPEPFVAVVSICQYNMRLYDTYPWALSGAVRSPGRSVLPSSQGERLGEFPSRRFVRIGGGCVHGTALNE